MFLLLFGRVVARRGALPHSMEHSFPGLVESFRCSEINLAVALPASAQYELFLASAISRLMMIIRQSSTAHQVPSAAGATASARRKRKRQNSSTLFIWSTIEISHVLWLWQADHASFRDRFAFLDLTLYAPTSVSDLRLRRELLQMQTSARLRAQLGRWLLAYQLRGASVTTPIKRLSDSSPAL